MTSQRKIIANRSNALRSSGPRTADGKRRASGNSRKHGWAALERHRPTASDEVERMASAICGEAKDPALLAQAQIIAENDLMRRAIRSHKLQVIEKFLADARENDAELQESVNELPHEVRKPDEYEALELAAADLNRLERYETRAWSRQMRAIRTFIELSRTVES